MGRSYTSRNSNSKAVHTHHEVTTSNKLLKSAKTFIQNFKSFTNLQER